MSRQPSRQAGFTIIELLVATMVFSVILLGATTALFQLEKMYYRGIITDRTQTTTRSIMSEISEQLQLNQNQVSFGGPITNGYTTGSDTTKFNAVCIATTRYSYVINAQVVAGSKAQPPTGHHIEHALWRDTIGPSQDCYPLDLSLANPEETPPLVAGGTAVSGTNGIELLAQNMRLASFSINPGCSDQSSRLCAVQLQVLYGDDDLLAPNADNPKGCLTTFGDQWCATSNLNTQVFKRLQ